MPPKGTPHNPRAHGTPRRAGRGMPRGHEGAAPCDSFWDSLLSSNDDSGRAPLACGDTHTPPGAGTGGPGEPSASAPTSIRIPAPAPSPAPAPPVPTSRGSEGGSGGPPACTGSACCHSYVHHLQHDVVMHRMARGCYTPAAAPPPITATLPCGAASPPPGAFAELPLPQALQHSLLRNCFTEPTPIQAAALPVALAGHDTAVVAPPGSGKTLCYLLAVGCGLLARGALRGGDSPSSVRLDHLAPSAVVVVPTREMALQAMGHAALVYAGTGLRVCGAYGGVTQRRQQDEAALQCRAQRDTLGCDVVVGCPGRIDGLLSDGGLTMSHTRFLVLDAASRLLAHPADAQELSAIASRSAIAVSRQTLLFTTLFTPENEELASDFLLQKGYAVLRQGCGNMLPDTVGIVLHQPSAGHDLEEVVRDVVAESIQLGKALVFVPHAADVRHWQQALGCAGGVGGSPCAALHSGMTQHARELALERFRDEVPLLVATDVVACGLDVHGITDVISIGLPRSPQQFVERAGRTGRRGRKGTCHLVACSGDPTDSVAEVLRLSGRKVPAGLVACDHRAGRR